MKSLFSILIFLIFIQNAFSQSVKIISTDSAHSSLRGLSVVDDKVIWVCGSNGTVGKSIDAGKTWNWMRVKDFEKTDFRDIEAFDKNTAVIMAVAEPAYILRTDDGGKNWKVVYENKTKGMFLDAMEFWNETNGIVIGDPLNHRFFIAGTFDGGKTWQNISDKFKPLADSGEACFASSGTNIRKLNKSEAVYVSGGLSSHIFIRNQKILLPLMRGKESTGANSIAVKDNKTMIVVGGDFLQKEAADSNCVVSTDGGLTWVLPTVLPSGYRSCVEYLNKNKWIACGLNGVDISDNNGMSWKQISKESFHVCRKAKNGRAVFLAGNGGRVGKLQFENVLMR